MYISEAADNSGTSGDDSGSDIVDEFKTSNKLGEVSITDVLENAKQFKVP